MTTDQRFTLIITCMSLLFVMMSALLGLIWKNGKTTGETNTEIKALAGSIKQVGDSLDRHINWHLERQGKR